MHGTMNVIHVSFHLGSRVADVQGTTDRRGRACPVPLAGEPGLSCAGDHKGRPYEPEFNGLGICSMRRDGDP